MLLLPLSHLGPRVGLAAAVGALLALGEAAGGHPAPGATNPRAQDAGDGAARAEAGLSWGALLARDARLAMNPTSATRAVAVLESPDRPFNERGAALFALGRARAQRERPRLESWAQEGAPAERLGAILGLGELGPGSEDFLLELLARGDRATRGPVLVALALAGHPRGLAEVRRLAAGGGEATAVAADALAFATDPETSSGLRPLRTLIDLRWESARRFGLVDGRAWSVQVLEALTADEAFLDDVIFETAADLPMFGVGDHYLEVALSPGRPRRLRGVVRALPTEVDRMVEQQLWLPANQEEWAEILHAIDRGRLETLTPNVLRTARLFPDLSTTASLLLVRAGNYEGLPLLELDLASPAREKRVRILDALGSTNDRRLLPTIAPLVQSEDPAVRLSARLALARLGDRIERDALRAVLAGDDEEQRDALVVALVRLANDRWAADQLATVAALYEGQARVAIELALARAGRPGDRGLLRQTLRATPPRGARGVEFLEALALNPSVADIDLMRELFPIDDEREANVALAVTLAGLHDGEVAAVLRAALWRGPWSRSLLAGAILFDQGGADALRLELARPPSHAGQRDRRRVGFVLGRFGGLAEVERLRSRRTAADPAVQGAMLGALGARTH